MLSVFFFHRFSTQQELVTDKSNNFGETVTQTMFHFGNSRHPVKTGKRVTIWEVFVWLGRSSDWCFRVIGSFATPSNSTRPPRWALFDSCPSPALVVVRSLEQVYNQRIITERPSAPLSGYRPTQIVVDQDKHVALGHRSSCCVTFSSTCPTPPAPLSPNPRFSHPTP